VFEGEADRDLVVGTPELVAFQYELSGLGTRFLAQLIDLCLLMAVLMVVVLGGLVLSVVSNGPAGAILVLVAAFALVWGYFIGFELAWSDQTPGKRAVGARVAGLHGEPAPRVALLIRNLLRLMDFLPVFYGGGVI